MTRINVLNYTNPRYTKATIHPADRRRPPTSIQPINKEECLLYIKKTFPKRLSREIYSAVQKMSKSSRKQQPTKDQIKTNYVANEQAKLLRRKGLTKIYNDTVDEWNADHPNDQINNAVVRKCVDSESIAYHPLWFDYIRENIDQVIDDLLHKNNPEVAATSTVAKTEYVYRTTSTTLKKCLRSDLEDSEKKIIMETIEMARLKVTTAMAELSTIVKLDMEKRTTGAAVNLESIFPVQSQETDDHLFLSPPSPSVKKGMTTHTYDSAEKRRIFDLYSDQHIMHIYSLLNQQHQPSSSSSSSS
ncbi:uncharacterized protein BX664DRAFT_384019, partial [Halteromyces radiatus]|uniref:uncharacterized protein n=1 Tax=Halteromyces radiatus TaxID=101107 RepID=UPI00221FB549